jgi:beta-lactamase regulating signal transducer with metallopeptidase domain
MNEAYAILKESLPAGSWVLAALAAKSLVALTCAFALAAALRGACAAMRHVVWASALSGAVLVPVAAEILPSWGLARAKAYAAEQGLAALSGSVPTEQGPSIPGGDAVILLSAWDEAGTVLVLLWMVGAVLLLVSLIRSCVQLRGMAGRARADADGRLMAAVTRQASVLGLRSPPLLVLSDEAGVPMTWGTFRPVIMLPAGACRWPEERLDAVLLHELAHVQRSDALLQLIAEVARVIYWYNPLVWLARTRLRLESEFACDDVVLRHGHQAVSYAGTLLDVARAAHGGRAAPALAAGLHDSELSRRIVALLDSRGSRRSAPLWQRASIVTVLIALSLVVSGMTLTPAAPVAERADQPPVSRARSGGPIAPRMPAAASDSAIELALLRHQPQLREQGLPRHQYVWIAAEADGAVVASGIADRRRGDSFTTAEVGDHIVTRLPERLPAYIVIRGGVGSRSGMSNTNVAWITLRSRDEQVRTNPSRTLQ